MCVHACVRACACRKAALFINKPLYACVGSDKIAACSRRHSVRTKEEVRAYRKDAHRIKTALSATHETHIGSMCVRVCVCI